MKYKLKVLSPLHIGCGEEYSGLTYLMDKRKDPPLINVLNEDLIFGILNDDQMKSFVTWLEAERFPNLFYFFKNILRDTNFALQNQLQKKAVYTIPIYAGGERLRGINSFIKQMHHPYIPGTEIKGAIRTAVLYCSLIDSKELGTWVESRLEKFKVDNANKIASVANTRKPNRKIKNDLAKGMSKIESEFQEKVLRCKPDAKYDIMKYLQVGDSELLDAGKHLAVSYVRPFNISGRPFTIFYEYIKDKTEISLTTFKLESSRSLPTKLDKMEFDDKHKTIVSGIDAVLNYCHRFSNDLLDEEVSFFQARGKQQIADRLKKIKSVNDLEAPVLRIGKDEGYNSLTVGLAVKKLDKALYENVLIHATKNKSYDSKHGGPMPKSRKIVHWNGEETTTGWVQLVPEIIPDSHPVSAAKPDKQVQAGHKSAASIDLSRLEDKFKVVKEKR